MIRSFFLLAIFPACELVIGSDDPNRLTLSNLSVMPGRLDQAFDPNTTHYTATIPVSEDVTFTVSSQDPDATIKVNDVLMINQTSEKLPVLAGKTTFTINLNTPQNVRETYFIEVNVAGVLFAEPVQRTLSAQAAVIKVADFDGDLTPDIAVATVGGIEIFDGKTFSKVGPTLVIAGTKDFAIGDLDGQNGPDIIAVTGQSTGSKFIRAANGTFSTLASVGSGGSFISVALGNLDSDGTLDVMFGDSGASRQVTFLGDGNGGFPGGGLSSNVPASNPVTTVLGEFDGLPGADAVVLDGQPGALGFLHGNNDGTFAMTGGTNTFASGTGIAASLVLAAIDDDTRPDFVVIQPNASKVSVTGNFTGGASPDRTLLVMETEQSPTAVVTADIDGDGDQDLLVVSTPQNFLTIFYNDGQGTFTPIKIKIGDGSLNLGGIATGDFNGDGLLDVVIIDQGQVLLFLAQVAK